jgi:hypothetical protein
MIRFQVMIDEETFRALRSLSQQEYRDWRLQAGFLIREALRQRGYQVQGDQSQKAGGSIASETREGGKQ